MIDLKLHIDEWFTINGLEIRTGVKYGTVVQLLWVNDTHVGMITLNGVRLCIRTYIARDILTLRE